MSGATTSPACDTGAAGPERPAPKAQERNR